jgi:hypothetical protein
MITARTKRRQHNGGAERVFERINRALAGPRTVKVGFPAGDADQGAIDKAIWNEFGTSRGIPERAFFRGAMADNRANYRNLMASDARKIIKGESDMRRTLNRLGLMAQGHVQESIVNLDTPPNAPSTIKAKGSSNPLIDSGEMRQSVSFSIE